MCNRKISSKTGILEISFGNGGGFTGEITSFTLKPDGRLFEADNSFLKEIDSKITLDIYSKAEVLKEYSFNKPDNIYSFIEIKSQKESNRIVWFHGSPAIDQNVANLHSKLMALIK